MPSNAARSGVASMIGGLSFSDFGCAFELSAGGPTPTPETIPRPLHLTQDALLPEYPLYPTIRYEPDGRNEHIDGERGWRANKGERNGDNIKQY